MGTWGYKTFENDGAADWLYDLEEAAQPAFLFAPLQAAVKVKGKVDLDDALEGLAAAEVIAGARHEPPRDVPRIARSWIKRVALVPKDADLKLALEATAKIATKSELADSWHAEGKLAAWQKEVAKLSKRLTAALRAKPPFRKIKPVVQRETLAELIIAVAEDKTGARRMELQKKLSHISNPDGVGGKHNGEKLNRLTPLHWVASRGLMEEAKLLIARGAKIDPKLPLMSSPLVFAMDAGHTEIVAFLLEAGADPDAALSSATNDDRVEIMRMALAHGASVNSAIGEGRWTPLMWAAYHGAVKGLELLLKSGANVNCTHENGDTPLHFVADGPTTHGDESDVVGRFSLSVKLLVEHGAKLNAVGCEGKTPLDLAESTAAEVPEAKKTVNFLRERGARNGKAMEG